MRDISLCLGVVFVPEKVKRSRISRKASRQMFADMDRMYQPYLDGTATDKRALKKQIGRYYKGLQKSLSPMSNEEQAAFDQAFIEYKKQKEAAIK